MNWFILNELIDVAKIDDQSLFSLLHDDGQRVDDHDWGVDGGIMDHSHARQQAVANLCMNKIEMLSRGGAIRESDPVRPGADQPGLGVGVGNDMMNHEERFSLFRFVARMRVLYWMAGVNPLDGVAVSDPLEDCAAPFKFGHEGKVLFP